MTKVGIGCFDHGIETQNLTPEANRLFTPKSK
jgi:hypothetical protein